MKIRHPYRLSEVLWSLEKTVDATGNALDSLRMTLPERLRMPRFRRGLWSVVHARLMHRSTHERRRQRHSGLCLTLREAFIE